MNKVTLTGNITRDIDLKYTPQGTAISKTAIAVSDGYGEKQKSYFIDITVWGKRAETFNQYLKKGDPILIHGKLIQETWTTQDGQKRSKHSIQVDEFEFMKRGNGEDAPNIPQETNSSNSSNKTTTKSGGEENSNGGKNIPEIDIDEEDIPF